MAEPPYRETVDRLGEDEREAEAVRVLGHWRDRTKATALAIGALAGLVIAGIGYYVMQEIELDRQGAVNVKGTTLAAIAIWIAVFFAAAFVGRQVVRARTPARLAELARVYEVPIEKLTAIANMVSKL